MDAKDKLIAELRAEIADLKAQLKAALEKIAALEKNSQTSHKPPSTDIVKPPKQKRKKKRKIGAQKGHKQHLRTHFPPEKVDVIVDLHPVFKTCPECNDNLVPSTKPPKIMQQIEIPERLISVTEFRRHTSSCGRCLASYTAPLSSEVAAAGLFGPNLTAGIGYLKGRCHLSYTSIQDFCRNMLGFDVSRGHLANAVRTVSESLAGSHAQLESMLPEQKKLKIDESTQKKNGVAQWVWVFVSTTFAFFCITAKRNSDVLIEKLGKGFRGNITSDFHSLYKKFGKNTPALFQFCWAHLIRDVKFLGMQDETCDYAWRVLKKIKAMFETIRDRENFTKQEYRLLLHEHRRQILAAIERDVPDHNLAEALENRMFQYSDEYFRFIDLDVDPTNNESEQMFRLLIVDRVVTQGTRSDWGDRWHERFLTAHATCRKRGINVMFFLRQSVTALFQGTAPPSLLGEIQPTAAASE
jgi:transposase